MFKRYLSKLFFVVVCYLVILSFYQPVFSQEDVRYEEGIAYLSLLRENLTSRKGVVSKSFSHPANITVINRKEVESLNAATVVDVLRLQQGIVVKDWLGTGKTVNVDIRGFGETGPSNTLVLVNGRRTNNIDMSNVDWAQIPLEAVESIEIIRGPSAAVLYGDNATGGVINIITRRGIGDTIVNIGAAAGSFNSTNFKVGLSGARDEVSYNVVASRNSTDGFRENSGITNMDINAFIVYDSPEVKTSLDIGYHVDNYGMPGPVSETDWIDNKLTKARTPDDNAKTNDSYIQISAMVPIAERLKNEFSVSMRNRLASSYFEFINFLTGLPDGSGEERKTDTFGIGNKLFFENPKVGSVIGGVEAYFSNQNIKNLDKHDTPLPGSTDIKKDSLAFYINNDIELLSEKLRLTAGARWELANYSFTPPAEGEVKISSAVLAYSLGASYLFDEKTSVYAKWSSGYRLPKVDEYYSVWTGLNSALQNQFTRTTEIGLKKIFTEELSSNISVFQTDSENEIYFNPFDPVTFTGGLNENYEKTRRFGAELGLMVEPAKNLTVRANYTYTNARITEGIYKDSTVPGVPRHSLALVNTLNFSKFNVSVSGNYVGERYFISDQRNISKKLDAYVRLDAKVAYKIRNMKLFAGINNILDAKYAEYGVARLDGTARNYYPSPKRNFFGGVEVNF